jgi:hypothetical protein
MSTVLDVPSLVLFGAQSHRHPVKGFNRQELACYPFASPVNQIGANATQKAAFVWRRRHNLIKVR